MMLSKNELTTEINSFFLSVAGRSTLTQTLVSMKKRHRADVELKTELRWVNSRGLLHRKSLW